MKGLEKQSRIMLTENDYSIEMIRDKILNIKLSQDMMEKFDIEQERPLNIFVENNSQGSSNLIIEISHE